MAQMAVSLRDIAAFVGGELVGDASLIIRGLAPLSEARPSDLSFLDNEKYLGQFEMTEAGAVIVGPDIEPHGRTRHVRTYCHIKICTRFYS